MEMLWKTTSAACDKYVPYQNAQLNKMNGTSFIDGETSQSF